MLETAGRARLLMYIDFAPRVLFISPLFLWIIAAQQHSHLTALNVVIKVSRDGACCLRFSCLFVLVYLSVCLLLSKGKLNTFQSYMEY